MAVRACYGCGAPFTRAGKHRWLPMAGTYRNAILVPRAERHQVTGLPRFGPSRRNHHGDARHARPREGTWVSSGDETFYVNCYRCDRGQVVEP